MGLKKDDHEVPHEVSLDKLLDNRVDRNASAGRNVCDFAGVQLLRRVSTRSY